MILPLFRKNAPSAAVFAIYNAIVAQSRQPRFYAEWSVPDTVTGRFDMISLHLALLFRRLRGEGPEPKQFSQSVFDLFFKDMDRSLREMGAGDLAVPKKIQQMGNIFFGLLAALNQAMDRGDAEAVAEVLGRNILDDAASANINELAAYLIEQDKYLAAQFAHTIIDGTIAFEAAA
ncbi:ubiquinol-cytochrome C chaperone family protein [Devosia rhodophyticola]|uniref:Ubiquinol-cytochrome C chaperone family protein n=1 Tax=Devosia rhodophyticola TaxID=3026423 RepID=A0ABY7YXY8_9HYPH|nr:ubiquinol-cytochrome C chaperone family protein [Devosia rhodophyticola]WDR06082.1 ubiquinol-cytochrome C chaperone family protein [Devosia rhodophyticola]